MCLKLILHSQDSSVDAKSAAETQRPRGMTPEAPPNVVESI